MAPQLSLTWLTLGAPRRAFIERVLIYSITKTPDLSGSMTKAALNATSHR